MQENDVLDGTDHPFAGTPPGANYDPFNNESAPGEPSAAEPGCVLANSNPFHDAMKDSESKNWGGAYADSPADDTFMNVSDDEGKHQVVNVYSSYGKVSSSDSDDEKEGCSWLSSQKVQKGCKVKVTCSYAQIRDSVKKRINQGSAGYLEKLTEEDINMFRNKDAVITDFELSDEIAEIRLRPAHDHKPLAAIFAEDVKDDPYEMDDLDHEQRTIWLPWNCLILDDDDEYDAQNDGMYSLD